MTKNDRPRRYGIVGAGNLATAIAHGVLETGHVGKGDLMLSDVDAGKLERLRARFGVATTSDNTELVRFADVVVIAVKPAHVADVLEQCKAAFDASKLLISVAAGVRIATLAARLPAGARIVRSMPNAAAVAQASATALCKGGAATDADLELARALFEAVGQCVVLDESHLDAVTGLSGSGPAYAMVFIDALADGGVRMGLSREVALALAAQTLLGAAKLVQASGEHPAVWKDRVTSPAGTTAAGLSALEAGAVRHVIASAVEQATLRARELGRAAQGS